METTQNKNLEQARQLLKRNPVKFYLNKSLMLVIEIVCFLLSLIFLGGAITFPSNSIKATGEMDKDFVLFMVYHTKEITTVLNFIVAFLVLLAINFLIIGLLLRGNRRKNDLIKKTHSLLLRTDS